ncbi:MULTISPECIES: transporter substrate-binding domain-containing protein [unclassified Rhizobium]|uniref:transporter substrate-binding domain-containing protein n=1 Tax=unclassified Rhizobium TaxID=2613769 RepID=UPI003822D5B4
MLRSYLAAALGASALAFSSFVYAGPVFDEVVTSQKVICLVSPSAPGFSVPDSAGIFRGFNADFCRMAAAAILGDANKADIRGVGFSDSLKNLVARQAHMAARSITETGTRSADPGLAFVATTFYDGQGFMVSKALGVTSAKELKGATICAEDGSTTLLNIADWFAAKGLDYKIENIADKTARLQAFFAGKCDAYASDVTALAADRQLAKNPGDFVILPEIISAEPLTLVTQPDDTLEKAVRWAFEVMLNADELGINSTNVDAAIANLDNQPKAVQRLFGKDGAAADMAAKMRLPADWAYQVIKQVGSYDEVFNRNLGPGTPFDLKRDGSQNASVGKGGLMYAYPIR